MKKRLLLIALFALLAVLLIAPNALALAEDKQITSVGTVLNDGDYIYQYNTKDKEVSGTERLGDTDTSWTLYIAQNDSSDVHVVGVHTDLDTIKTGYVLITSKMTAIQGGGAEITSANKQWYVYKLDDLDNNTGVYGKVYICPLHSTHSWSFASSGNTLYAYCSNQENPCTYYNKGISSPLYYSLNGGTFNMTYGGTFAATVAANTMSSYATPSIQSYSFSNGTGTYTNASELPVGTYSAMVNVTTNLGGSYPLTGITLNVQPASQTAAAVNMEASFAWNEQTDKVPSVTGAEEDPDTTYWYYKDDNATFTTKDYSDTLTLTQWTSETKFTPGKYYMFAKLGKTTNYKATNTQGKLFEVTGSKMADLTVESITDTYGNEKSWSIDVSSKLPDDIQGVKISYKLNGTDFGYTNPVIENAGVYTVDYKIISDNYYEYNGTATVNIAPRSIGVTLSIQDKTYDGDNTATVVATITNVADGDSIDISGLTATFDDGKDAGVDKAVTVSKSSWANATIVNKGTSTVNANYTKPSILDSDFYEYTATISPLEAVLTPTPTSIPCESNPEKKIPDDVSIDVEVSNKVVGDNVTVTFTAPVRDKATGDVFLTVTELSDPNYVLPATTKLEIPVIHAPGVTLEWDCDRTTHQKLFECCKYVAVDKEPHEWKDGVCTECGYVCDAQPGGHTGGTANCTGRAICQYCGERYGEYAPDNHICLNHYTREDGADPEYWYCIGCNRYFLDANHTIETTKDKLVIAGVDSPILIAAASAGLPQTGDEGGISLWAVLLLVSGAGTVLALALRRRTSHR